jgi:hypothetical protein
MSYINYNEPDDMQDDTFKVVMQLIIKCIDSQSSFMDTGTRGDVCKLYSTLLILYSTIWKRLGSNHLVIQKILKNCRDMLFSKEKKESPEKVFEILQEVYRIMAGILDDKGLLFKAKADLDSLVAR